MKKKGCEKIMLELEEAKPILKELERRLKEMGESLWHFSKGREIKRVRKSDKWSSILDESRKFCQSFTRNEAFEG